MKTAQSSSTGRSPRLLRQSHSFHAFSSPQNTTVDGAAFFSIPFSPSPPATQTGPGRFPCGVFSSVSSSPLSAPPASSQAPAAVLRRLPYQ